MKTIWLPGTLAIALGCAAFPPQTAPLTRTGTPVQASFGKAWDAVIDLFSDQNISIHTIDRSSGLIVADPVTVSGSHLEWADCGTDGSGAIWPDLATYNVLVRGDSIRATVKVTVRWVGISRAVGSYGARIECVSKGAWETDFEQAVLKRAEDR